MWSNWKKKAGQCHGDRSITYRCALARLGPPIRSYLWLLIMHKGLRRPHFRAWLHPLPSTLLPTPNFHGFSPPPPPSCIIATLCPPFPVHSLLTSPTGSFPSHGRGWHGLGWSVQRQSFPFWSPPTLHECAHSFINSSNMYQTPIGQTPQYHCI